MATAAAIVIPTTMVTSVVFEPFTVKTTAGEVTSVVPVEIGAIVFVVYTVTIVAIPYRVVIVNIPGEIVLIYYSGGSRSIIVLAITILIISVLTYRCGSRSGVLLIYYGRRRGRGRGNINPGAGYTYTDTGVKINLRVSGAGDQGTGEDRGKYK